MILSSCLTDGVLVDLVERRLSEERVSAIHRHAVGCPPCRELLLAMSPDSPVHQAPDREEPLPEATLASDPGPPSAGPVTGTWTPPTLFDEFALLKPLGQGGMGIVYLARDTLLDRLVAIKFIASYQPSATARALFETEARAIARLTHPNVAILYRVGEVNGHPYLVSEYVLGQRLSSVAAPLPWRRVLTIGRGLARGLAAAHRQGVLHRDIKPSNAMLSFDEEVKLLDFGLAKLMDLEPGPGTEHEQDTGTAAKERSVAGGTPRYMAPEVFTGMPASAQSDLYSLGLVLYELCTDRLPGSRRSLFEPEEANAASADPAAGVAGLGEWEQRALCDAVPGIDPDFAAVIERCLATQPGDRFASAETLTEALDALGSPGVARLMPDDNPYRGLHPFEAEHRALFFGRDDDIRAVLGRLRQESLVLIAGDSGVGKSSLCRAGILPRVADGTLDTRRGFDACMLWPGRHPVAALAAVLAPLLSQKEAALTAALMAPAQVAWLGHALREQCRGPRGVFLLVDQLEELLTLSDAAEATRFAEILAELALPAEGVRVLLAVRGDFLTRLGALPGLGENLERALYLLRPLSSHGVRQAIVGPARDREVTFESDALVAELVASKEQGAGWLPLLQFALAELWELRDKARGCISQAALTAMGGVAGSLSRHADAIVAVLNASGQETARRVLVRLVTEENTQVPRGEAELGITDEAARAVVHTLVQGRLLYASPAGGETTYQIAHEALIEGWHTLRTWLDEDIGQRAIRQRLEAAAAEWERLGRASVGLWGLQQLEEATAIDVRMLGEREQAFVERSRRALRRQQGRRRLIRFGIGLVPLLLVLGPYLVLRVQRHLENEHFIAALLVTARTAWTDGRTHNAKANVQREQAIQLFDGPVLPGQAVPDHPSWAEADTKWTHVLAEVAQAEMAYGRADQALATALLRDSSHRDARRLQAELTYERILMAERFQRNQQRSELVSLLERLDEDRRWRDRLSVPAELSVDTTPPQPGLRVSLRRYVDDRHGRRYLENVPGLGELAATPIAHVQVPPGSYLLELMPGAGEPIRLPLWLERGEHRPIRLPLPRAVPAGYAYIPPGCFLFGSGDPESTRKFMHVAPLHRICRNEGYLIGRTEVTVSDWLAYLGTLPEGAPPQRLLAEPRWAGEGMLLLKPERGSGWTYAFSVSPNRNQWPSPRREGELFRYPARSQRAQQDWRRFPLAGVSPKEFTGYLDWLDRSGRVRGARLCREDEWEHAARGADDRRYPHGDQLLAEEANIDVTYGRKQATFGPDAVGSYPASASPFGVLDMSGNAFEWTTSMPSEPGTYLIRGGAWYYDAGLAALIYNRTPTEPDAHDVRIGFRVCAPVLGL